MQAQSVTTELTDGLYAVFETNRGQIVSELYFQEAPLTVSNFVGLAEGTKEWKEGATVKVGEPFYDGLLFHRVVADFMIQGGDPTGTGRGGPGYQFQDEIIPELKHDGPGIMSMANSGPDTNGSQFFITHKDTPWLDGKHAVFGRVVQGQDVVDSIAQGDTMRTVKILRKGPEAEAFTVTQQSFESLIASISEKERAEAEEAKRLIEDEIKTRWPDAVHTESGLRYDVLEEGEGESPVEGSIVEFHFEGSLMDVQNGEIDVEVLENSRNLGNAGQTVLGQRPILKGLEETFYAMRKGERRIAIIPSNLAYFGSKAQTVVPDGTYIIYDIELLKISAPEKE